MSSAPESPAPDDSDQILEHPAVRRVREALAAAGVTGAPVVLAEHAPTAATAAAQLDCTVAAIANSLVFAADGEPLLVLTSGGHRVDTAKVAALLGAAKVSRADPELVREATGMAIGGVAPVGHATAIRTLVDIALADHDVVWAAAGHPRTVFPTTYDELVRVTGGTPAEVA
jgi:prolyl-tRNA editing enzyme YbaK/EbsC (Cys-tRNA(Pro) deacylase)